LGFGVRRFRKLRALAKTLASLLRNNPRLTFVATGVTQSIACIALNILYRRQINHLHIVHGGAGERGSYGNKKWLNNANVTFVTVSDFARDRLIANGVRADRIRVVHNFLTDDRIVQAPRRPAFVRDGVRTAVLVSRLDPLKRVSLLLDALDLESGLREISFKIYGLGPEYNLLRERAMKDHPNVEFAGFCADVASALPEADLLVHTCPVESFGLVVLEAMAANVPVLVPDAGGTGLMVTEGTNGFKYRAEDARDLARRLLELKNAPADALNRAAVGGEIAVNTTFSAETALMKYRELFSPAA
jgi:glycosyltransferase involved in cell wall biosynthesis